MKKTKLSVLLTIFIMLTGKAFSTGISISGETDVNSASNYTYYATPGPPIPPSGYSYTWHVAGGTIIEQNTDPYTGSLYCIVHWDSVLGEGYVQIEDNHGNDGLLFTTLYGLTKNEPHQYITEVQEKAYAVFSHTQPGNYETAMDDRAKKLFYQFQDAIRQRNKFIS